MTGLAALAGPTRRRLTNRTWQPRSDAR